MRKKLIILGSILFVCNLILWIAAFQSLSTYPLLFGLIVIAYGLGLRHAVDADHIAAIDNVTRKLVHDGQKPIGVGFFFALGHSTIVIILAILVAFSASYVNQNLPAFKETSSLIGAIVSSIFLLLIGIINLIALIGIYKVWKQVKNKKQYDKKTIDDHIHTKGVLARILKPLLKTVTKSWHMYPIGLLFGLGFDTATEIALLSLSAATGVNNIPIHYILLLPLAFTAGMLLIDTLDGILMLGAYGWAYIKPVRKLYYNMLITAISVTIALTIGTVQTLQIISEQTGVFQFINNLQFENLGIITIIIFAICWLIFATIYKLKIQSSK